MSVDFVHRYPLSTFYAIAYAFTWSLGVPLLLSRRGLIGIDVTPLVEPVAAFGPFIAAFVVLRAHDRHDGPRALLQGLLQWRTRPRWWIAALLSPPALLLLAVVGDISAGNPLDSREAAVGELWSMTGLFELIVVGGILQSLGEEPGWRGYAVPKLRERFGPMATTLALWPVWLCWHLPFFLSRPSFGWPQWFGFSVGILSAAIWLTWLRDRTQSILLCIGWHAVANICRNTALALSTMAFLLYNNLVLLGAVLIAGYWIRTALRNPPVD